MLLAYDLIQTLRNPIESGAERLERIMPYSIVLFFVWVFYVWGLMLTGNNEAFQIKDMTCANATYDYSYRPLDISYGILFLVYLTYSVINTFCGLNRKGMNKEMRNTFFCRQVMFLLIMLLT